MNHLSKAKNTSNASKASSNGAGGASSPPLSPFTKMANSPATKGNKEKTARIFKIIIDGQTICLVLTDFYDAKSWLEYQELINGKGNYHPNKVTYLANLRRLTFPGNVYVQEQVLKAIEQILEPEIMSGTKPMTFLPMIDHPKISSESLNGVVKFLVDNLQGQPVPLSNSVFNIVVKNVVLSEDQIECFSVFMVNILPTEIATQIVRNLDDEMYRYGPVISSVVSTSMTSSITIAEVPSVLSSMASSEYEMPLTGDGNVAGVSDAIVDAEASLGSSSSSTSSSSSSSSSTSSKKQRR